MNAPRTVAIAAAMLAVWSSATIAQSARPDTLAIEGAAVVPMDRDTVLLDHTVLVSQDRIVWIGPSRTARIPRGARRVDGRGGYLIPGLADMHVHLESSQELPLYVAAGVTTVSNMNGRPIHIVWRNRVAAGSLRGPRIFTAGTAVGARASDTHVRVRTAAEAEELVRRQRQAGYDMIKVQGGLDLPVFQRLAEAARAAHMPLVGHVVEGIGSKNALAAGQISLEHLNIHLFEGGEAQLDGGAQAIARAGVRVGTLISSGDRTCGGRPTDLQRRIIAALRSANVRMLAGTDASLGALQPGAALHCELVKLVAAGLSPYEALVTATRNAGEFAREQLKESVPFGTVTVGSRADLVLLKADPRIDISAVTRPVGTVLRGVWIPQ